MEGQKTVSIIMGTYNGEKFIREQLDSILAQTYPIKEIIIQDDGSTDGTIDICDEYAAQNPRVRVLHQPNGGQSAAREAGFHASSGKYIAFADSDDHVDPHMYSDISALAEKYHADIVHCDFTAVMPGKEKVCAVPYPAGLYDKQLCAGLVQVAEINNFGTLRRLGEGRDAKVYLAGLHGGDDAVKRHIDHFKLHADGVRYLLGQPHVAAGEVGVEILELIGGVLRLGADDKLALGLDAVKQAFGCRFLCGGRSFCRGRGLFGGGGFGDTEPVSVERVPSHGREQSLCIKIPPFGGVFYQGRGRLPQGKRKGAEA